MMVQCRIGSLYLKGEITSARDTRLRDVHSWICNHRYPCTAGASYHFRSRNMENGHSDRLELAIILFIFFDMCYIDPYLND